MDPGKFSHGLWWPTDIKPTAANHALDHVRHADLAISMAEKSIAIQAGGNVGLWPLRMAPHFAEVHTFEPDATSFHFLTLNTADVKNIFRKHAALGAAPGRCSIDHKSLGSHKVIEGDAVEVETIDRLFPSESVGLLQLDVEGYELEILKGAHKMLARCAPVVQLELRGMAGTYDASDDAVRAFMIDAGYFHFKKVGGADVVFWRGKVSKQ